MNDAQNTRELMISLPEAIYERIVMAADRDDTRLSDIAAEWIIRGMLEDAKDEHLGHGAMCQVH